MDVVRLKRFVMVDFESGETARKALYATLKRFNQLGSRSDDLSYCDRNRVYLFVFEHDNIKVVENFLRSQEGALPKGSFYN